MSRVNKISVKVKAVLSSILDVSDKEISEDFSITNCKSWDSLKHLNIIFSLEEVFRIDFSDSDMEEINSFLKITKVIQEKLKSND